MGFASEWRRVMDLSPDQLRVYDAVLAWLRNPREKLLTLGGYAGCLSGDTTIRYSRGALSVIANCRFGTFI